MLHVSVLQSVAGGCCSCACAAATEMPMPATATIKLVDRIITRASELGCICSVRCDPASAKPTSTNPSRESPATQKKPETKSRAFKVEPAGVEPASANRSVSASTCVVRRLCLVLSLAGERPLEDQLQ